MLIEMKDIVVDFGPVRAVNHVDFTVHPGEIVGLLGENGAGKSTLMNVLAGGLQPDEGSICLDGQKVKWRHQRRYHHHCGAAAEPAGEKGIMRL